MDGVSPTQALYCGQRDELVGGGGRVLSAAEATYATGATYRADKAEQKIC